MFRYVKCDVFKLKGRNLSDLAFTESIAAALGDTQLGEWRNIKIKYMTGRARRTEIMLMLLTLKYLY